MNRGSGGGERRAMHYILEYLSMSYITLVMLAGLVVMLIANRRMKLEGLQLVWILLGLVFLLSVGEYLEYWCEAYQQDILWKYVKTSGVYCIYPLIALLELRLIAPQKSRRLLVLPYCIFAAIEVMDLYDAGLTYYFTANYRFHGGILRILPMTMSMVYLLWLMYESFGFLRRGNRSKALIVIFMAGSTMLTALLEYLDIIVGMTEEVAAFDLIVYFVYLAAICHSETQEELHRRELELAKSQQNLLMAQIKPHFVNNALLAIQESCYEDPEKAADLIGHFSRYLRNNITATDSDAVIPFGQEIEAVKEYLALEYADPSKCFRVEYDLRFTDFRLPALSMEPLVENAVKHGIDRYSENARVRIVSFRKRGAACIEIRDNGKGFEVNAETLGKGGIGFRNAGQRLEMLCGGTLKVRRENGWTIAEIRIPIKETEGEPHHENDHT